METKFIFENLIELAKEEDSCFDIVVGCDRKTNNIIFISDDVDICFDIKQTKVKFIHIHPEIEMQDIMKKIGLLQKSDLT